MEQGRLDKRIANTGAHSRKETKELIRKGLVLVNGQRATSGEQKVGPGDEITVNGVSTRGEKHLYIMMNKPQGILCATRDRDQSTVLDLLPVELRRQGLFPAGRLDKDTEGFVLLTDDGAFAHRILSPRSHVPKTYHARLDGPLNMQEAKAAFAKGLPLGGGDICSPAEIELLEEGEQPLVEVVIHEGMYHQIKRMFRQLSRTVLWLKRVAIGSLYLDDSLNPGSCREILHKEREKISESFDRFGIQNLDKS